LFGSQDLGLDDPRADRRRTALRGPLKASRWSATRFPKRFNRLFSATV
jgi:hypothetical protein